MKFRFFFLSVIPYIVVIIIIFLICIKAFNNYERDIFNEIVHQEYKRLSQDITNVLEKEEDYEEIIKAIIEQYRMGNYTYAWLIDKQGKEIAFSQNKRYIEPQSLLFDKKNILPYIMRHLPTGENYFGSKPLRKYIKYSEIQGTDFILVIVGTVPEEDLPHQSFYKMLMLSLLGLFLLGLIMCSINTELIVEPIARIANYALRVSLEEQPEKPNIKFDPETELIVLALEKIKKMLSERQIPDLNPITNLPGNYALEKHLFDAIDSKEKFAVGAINVYNFSSYNHKYGFKKGDSVIRFMGSTIQSVFHELGEKNDFVSHLTGDRFVFITKSGKIDTICAEIIKRFDEHICFYYDEIDRERGYILSKNRRGEIQKYPIMRITIAVASNFSRPLIHPLQIAHITQEILDFLKKQEKSSYLIDRRMTDRGPDAEDDDNQDIIQERETEKENAVSNREKSAEHNTLAPVKDKTEDTTE